MRPRRALLLRPRLRCTCRQFGDGWTQFVTKRRAMSAIGTFQPYIPDRRNPAHQPEVRPLIGLTPPIDVSVLAAGLWGFLFDSDIAAILKHLDNLFQILAFFDVFV
jgi:hypothetical protein